LRVRMGAHIGTPECKKASLLSESKLYEQCHAICEFAHGGQILVTNQVHTLEVNHNPSPNNQFDRYTPRSIGRPWMWTSRHLEMSRR
jgi:hypothetical protein